MTFSINDIYKANSPRGEQWRSVVNTWTSGESNTLTVSPATTPENYALLVKSMKFSEASFVTSGTGAGMMQLSYPDPLGTTSLTYTFTTLDAMKLQADRSISTATDGFSFELIFEPPILLKASGSVSDLITQVPTDISISSGTFNYMFKGWTLKESDYD